MNGCTRGPRSDLVFKCCAWGFKIWTQEEHLNDLNGRDILRLSVVGFHQLAGRAAALCGLCFGGERIIGKKGGIGFE